VDARDRVLVTVVSQSLDYKAALLDPATKSLTVIPVVIEGDVAGTGWTPDGRILADGDRYFLTLWRYQRAASMK
jgi:hypothetical protein